MSTNEGKENLNQKCESLATGKISELLRSDSNKSCSQAHLQEDTELVRSSGADSSQESAIMEVSADAALGEDPPPESKSEISEQLERLRGVTLQAISVRERLPQPLFWSLFHAELEDIKKKREKKRSELKQQFSADWL